MHSTRLFELNDRPIRPEGSYVLYWMTSARRPKYNFALEHAIEQANILGKGLIVFEGLRMDYRWASDRMHQFVLDGMKDNSQYFQDTTVTYIPCIETPTAPIKEIFWALVEQSCLVVTDLFPAFFLSKMQRLAAERASIKFEQVDGNGVYPLREAGRIFTTAASFRRHIQKTIHPFLTDFPTAEPTQRLKNTVQLTECNFSTSMLSHFEQDLSTINLSVLPIDHSVPPVKETVGGYSQAEIRLNNFLQDGFTRYDTDRNSADKDPSSGLSPYLHFGHISAHELVERIWKYHDWTPSMVAPKANGSRSGWWNLPAPAEAFLDQIITWRDLGFVFCYEEPNFADYDTLPEWARTTMADHLDDPRPIVYSLETFERAETHDPIWNAAQRELIQTGRIHNYLRMLWAKKVLHWTEKPQDALQILEHLNNKYALDGRDPNSYSGIYWTFGRFDRAWTERPIFGKIRYMTSDSTKRKMKLHNYLITYGPSVS